MEQLEQQNTAVSLQTANLPDLNKASVSPIELLGEYWSPAEPGEKKRVFFLCFDTQTVLEPQTGEAREMNIIKFLENRNGEYRTIRNGSALLLAQFEPFAPRLKQGDPFEITYIGKKKTTTGKLADSWIVKPLYFEKAK